MKIGIVVDGQAESQALKFLFDNIVVPHSQFVNPLYADMQPKSTPAQIARSAYSKLCILKTKDVDKMVVMIDNEDRMDCHIDFARDIEVAFKSLFNMDVDVVVKKKCFENWLISDPEGLGKHKSRLTITKSFIDNVIPNKADSVTNPVKLLNTICNKREYHKRIDAIIFAKTINPAKMASNSRSFRKFLRVIGFPTYSAQSKTPSW